MACPYCPGAASFTLAGQIMAGYPTTSAPWADKKVSLVYKVCDELSVKSGPQGDYCSDGHLEVMQTTTDCSGNYSFTVAGKAILGAALLLGPFIVNPNYKCGPPSDPSTQNYIVEDPAYLAQYCPGGDNHWTVQSGTATAIGGPDNFLSDRSDYTGTYNQSLCSGQILPGSGCQGIAGVGMNVWTTGATARSSVECPPASGNHMIVANGVAGSYTLNLRLKLQFGMGLAYVQKDGKWYVAGSATFTATDSCAHSEAGLTANQTFGVVDGTLLTGITITGGLPVNCATLTGPVDPPQNLWHPGQPLPLPKCVFSEFKIDVYMGECNAAASTERLQVDSFEKTNTLLVAWVSGTGAGGPIKAAVHRAPQVGIGNSSYGWEAIQTVEAGTANDIGCGYLPNGRVYLCYDMSGVKKFRTNDRQGATGGWSATGTPNPAVSRHSATGRGQELGWRFRAKGSQASAGNIEFSFCGDNLGAVWEAPVVAEASALGPWCGGTWLENGWGLMYITGSAGAPGVNWKMATDPFTWGAGTSLGLAANACSVARNRSNVLCACLWTAAGATSVIRSRDEGLTWDAPTTVYTQSQSEPPMITSLGNTFYIVWQTGDQPQFIASVDGGVTWDSIKPFVPPGGGGGGGSTTCNPDSSDPVAARITPASPSIVHGSSQAFTLLAQFAGTGATEFDVTGCAHTVWDFSPSISGAAFSGNIFMTGSGTGTTTIHGQFEQAGVIVEDFTTITIT